jgi:hypothetical protein
MAERRATTICHRTIAACLIGLLGLSPSLAAAAQEVTVSSQSAGQGSGGAANQQPQSRTQEDDSLPDAPPTPQATSAPSNPPQHGDASAQLPAGTAAAGIENTAGVAASKPAGVAVAPPKQHRVRMLVIKVGAIVGAGAAIGTVAALSKASPSKPPGAH